MQQICERLITLYKYGGVYFDLDFIIIQNLDYLPPNFAPQERPRKGIYFRLLNVIFKN